MLLAKRKLSPELYSLLRKYNIKVCYLFGSQREEGERFFDGKKVSTQQGSDLDVGIVMGEGLANIQRFIGYLREMAQLDEEQFFADIRNPATTD